MNRTIEEETLTRRLHELADVAELTHPEAPRSFDGRTIPTLTTKRRRPALLAAAAALVVLVVVGAALVARRTTAPVAVDTGPSNTSITSTTSTSVVPAYTNDVVGFSITALPPGIGPIFEPRVEGNAEQNQSYQAFGSSPQDGPSFTVAVTHGIPADDVIRANDHPDSPLVPVARLVDGQPTFLWTPPPVVQRGLVWIAGPTTVVWLNGGNRTDDELFALAATIHVRT